MTYLTDARLLASTFYSHHDPEAPGLDRMPRATQEAWLLVAAAAKLLTLNPEPLSQLQPGHLYMARWHERDSWYGDAPRRPSIVTTIDDKFYAFHPQEHEIPLLLKCPLPPFEVRRFPGLIYDETL